MEKIFWTKTKIFNVDYSLFATDKGICWLGSSFEKGKAWIKQKKGEVIFVEDHHNPLLAIAVDRLQKYTKGEKVDFKLQYDLYGTPFQKSIWQEMTHIPYGETYSYKKMATLVGRPKATRAVGAACGANPVMILIPCHRVIGSNGKLTGYGGGLPTKEKLLSMEQSYGQHRTK